MTLRRIIRDVKDLERDPPENLCAGPIDDDLFKWNATTFVDGPDDSPYKDGI